MRFCLKPHAPSGNALYPRLDLRQTFLNPPHRESHIKLATQYKLVIVETIVARSRALGLNVVAEGVEIHEQPQCLSPIGCDSIQGCVIDRPEPLGRCLDSIEKINGMGIPR